MILNILLQVVTVPVTDSTGATAANTGLPPVLPAPTEDSLSLWELLMKGGYVMIPIALLFIIALYIFFERLIVISKAGKGPANFLPSLKDFIGNGNLDAARALCLSSTAPVAKMIAKGLGRLGKPIKEIEQSMENAGKLELYRLERGLGVLSIVGRIAPMLGFIGTIIGVINIFYMISLANTVEIDVISGGLYQKMITSAAGLAVGIFAFACHHILQGMVERRAQRMEADSMEFLDIIQTPSR